MNPIHTLSVLRWGPAPSHSTPLNFQERENLRDELIADAAPNPFGNGKDFFKELFHWLLNIASFGFCADVRSEQASTEYKFFRANVVSIRNGLTDLLNNPKKPFAAVRLTNDTTITFARNNDGNLKAYPNESPDQSKEFDMSALEMLQMIDGLVQGERYRFPAETVRGCNLSKEDHQRYVLLSLSEVGLIEGTVEDAAFPETELILDTLSEMDYDARVGKGRIAIVVTEIDDDKGKVVFRFEYDIRHRTLTISNQILGIYRRFQNITPLDLQRILNPEGMGALGISAP